MLFNSLSYAFFLPAVFIIYWVLPQRHRWILLLLASYFFYMFSEPKYGIIIGSMTFVSYVSARLLENSGDFKRKKFVLAATIVICIGALLFFKYFNFFSNNIYRIIRLFGVRQDAITLHIVLPVGISFYTFQTMSYIIDVYRGTVKAEHHFGKYAAFVSFFPQLVAGPIERPKNLLPQIHRKHNFDYDLAMQGAKLILWGYYKKLVIADVLSPYVQTVYQNPHEYSGFSLIVASVFFTIQIYCDFSGYSDIAIGTAKLFGINLTANFKSPYFSRSIREFWSRWHISLSAWFKDYVYIPLGGSRVKKIRHYVNLLLTFLLSGLWHGADWTFVVWGGIHGTAQIAEDAILGRTKESANRFAQIIQIIAVFAFCTFAWIFFVSSSIEDAVYVIQNCLVGVAKPITYLHDGFANIGFGKGDLAVMGICVITMAIYDAVSLKTDFVEWIAEKNKALQWMFYLLIGLMIVFLSEKGVAAEFIYFQF